MSLWNLSQGLHFGFSTISLAKVWIKHLFKETRHDFNPRCVSLCFCLFCSIEVNCCIYYSVLVFKFVFVDLLLSLTIEATVILPVVLVWSVEDQAAVCTVGLCRRAHEPQTCWSNATGRAKASNWQAARVDNSKFSVNHIRSHKHLHKVNISWMKKTSIIHLISHQCLQRCPQFFISGCRVSVDCRRLDQALSKWLDDYWTGIILHLIGVTPGTELSLVVLQVFKVDKSHISQQWFVHFWKHLYVLLLKAITNYKCTVFFQVIWRTCWVKNRSFSCWIMHRFRSAMSYCIWNRSSQN